MSRKLLGLRFDSRDAKLLRKLEQDVKSGLIAGSANVFGQAALAAEQGCPLEVYHDDPIEVVQMAAMYIRCGCRQPVIEELHRSGPDRRR